MYPMFRVMLVINVVMLAIMNISEHQPLLPHHHSLLINRPALHVYCLPIIIISLYPYIVTV